MYRPIAQVRLLEVWLAVTLIYFVVGFLFLAARHRRLDDPRQRRSHANGDEWRQMVTKTEKRR